MGYIFDAINKKNTEPTEDQSPNAIASDSSSPEQEIGNSLPSLVAHTHQDELQADEQEDTPLHLADLQLAINTDDNGDAALTTKDTAEPQIQHVQPQATTFADDKTTANQEPVPENPGITQPVLKINNKPKTNWWNKLLGRHFSSKVDDRLVAMTKPASATSEEYRALRTSILARHDNERHLVHTITSATPQEGKTITCVNLGMSFAELRNRETIIIECDLRLPTFGKLLNCDNKQPGLIDYLRGNATVSEIVQQIEGSALHIITAGGMVSDEAVQLLSSQRMSNLIHGLRSKYDHVFIDTPPVLQLADAGILGSQGEEVLVVARMRRTPRPLVEQAINTLTSYNAQVSGIIATDNPRSRGRGYGYKYGYRYSYGYTPDRKGRHKKRRAA